MINTLIQRQNDIYVLEAKLRPSTVTIWLDGEFPRFLVPKAILPACFSYFVSHVLISNLQAPAVLKNIFTKLKCSMADFAEVTNQCRESDLCGWIGGVNYSVF